MNYLKSAEKLPGVTYVDNAQDLEVAISEAVRHDDGNYFTQAQVKSLLSRGRQRALA